MLNNFNTLLDEEESDYVELPNELEKHEDVEDVLEKQTSDEVEDKKPEIEEQEENEVKENYEETPVVDEQETKEEHKIYGGINPLDNVNLTFDDDVEKPLYTTYTSTKDLTEVLNNISKEVKEEKKEDEEIEML